MKGKSFIEVSPLFGSFDGRTGKLLAILPDDVCSVEYGNGRLRFYFTETPSEIPSFLREMYPHGSFVSGFYGKQ